VVDKLRSIRFGDAANHLGEIVSRLDQRKAGHGNQGQRAASTSLVHAGLYFMTAG
jgi:hypothetical protein